MTLRDVTDLKMARSWINTLRNHPDTNQPCLDVNQAFACLNIAAKDFDALVLSMEESKIDISKKVNEASRIKVQMPLRGNQYRNHAPTMSQHLSVPVASRSQYSIPIMPKEPLVSAATLKSTAMLPDFNSTFSRQHVLCRNILSEGVIGRNFLYQPRVIRKVSRS